MRAARPLQAALASGTSFSVGAALPLAVAWLTPMDALIAAVALTSLLCLATLGGLAARAGGARVATGAARVTLWGTLAMLATAGIGRLFGSVVG